MKSKNLAAKVLDNPQTVATLSEKDTRLCRPASRNAGNMREDPLFDVDADDGLEGGAVSVHAEGRRAAGGERGRAGAVDQDAY
jgi:hypothetical protein